MSERHDEQQHEQGQIKGLRPRVWIGSLADYNAGRLLGEWTDAAVETEELLGVAERIMATSERAGAKEWAIFDFDGFGSYRVGEHDELGSVAAVARGIAHHGAAYASWAERSRDDGERRERFEEAFLGEYASRDTYVDFVLDGMEIKQALATAIPLWLQAYVRVDGAALLRDLELGGGIDVEEAADGAIWVFDTRV